MELDCFIDISRNVVDASMDMCDGEFGVRSLSRSSYQSRALKLRTD